MKFNSMRELYIHVLPALRCKKHEMQLSNNKIVLEEDIWAYLRNNKWKHATNLTLSEMVNDILNVDDKLVIDYTILNLRKRDEIK